MKGLSPLHRTTEYNVGDADALPPWLGFSPEHAADWFVRKEVRHNPGPALGEAQRLLARAKADRQPDDAILTLVEVTQSRWFLRKFMARATIDERRVSPD